MTQRIRKLVGTIVMVVLLIAYSIGATAIYINFLAGMPWWVLIPYFAVAGLGSFFPAALLIRWMNRPDA